MKLCSSNNILHISSIRAFIQNTSRIIRKIMFTFSSFHTWSYKYHFSVGISQTFASNAFKFPTFLPSIRQIFSLYSPLKLYSSNWTFSDEVSCIWNISWSSSSVCRCSDFKSDSSNCSRWTTALWNFSSTSLFLCLNSDKYFWHDSTCGDTTLWSVFRSSISRNMMRWHNVRHNCNILYYI